MKKRKYKNIKNNNIASFPVLETLISIGICVTLLTVFFTSLNNTYNIEKRPEIDLYEKGLGILEQLISTQGQVYKENPCWDGEPEKLNTLGLGTSRTIAYGVLYYDETNNRVISLGDQYSFLDGDIGVIEKCFLKGTKVLMADESYKNIEELTIGEIVKSYDLENDKFVSSKISNIFYYDSDDIESDYYLLLNNELKVTPNHKFYSEGKWVSVRDLKVGDMLFSPEIDYYIYSIDKIYEKQHVYNLGIDNFHNFFVKIDDFYVLVHNELLYADFTWYDKDGLQPAGKEIHFDASVSLSNVGIQSYKWDFNNDDLYEKTGDTQDHNFGDEVTHPVSLKITDNNGNEHICTKIVQANYYEPPDLEEWIETDFVAYPETGTDTLESYDENYYIKYSKLEVSHDDNYFLYEVKEKNNNYYSILDFDKIEELGKISENEDIYEDIYNDFKSDFGLETIDVLYNFHITINRQQGLPITFGASYENINVMQSISKDVLIYHRPETSGYDIIKSPSYEKARVTVRVFIGGYFE